LARLFIPRSEIAIKVAIFFKTKNQLYVSANWLGKIDVEQLPCQLPNQTKTILISN
jgi:hypothetical protein